MQLKLAFFFLSTLVLQALFRGNELIRSYMILFHLPGYSLFYEKNTPLWPQQISFLNDSEERLLQTPLKARKLARNSRTAVEGGVAILLGMLH